MNEFENLLPEDSEYVLNLPYHLAESGMTDDLCEILTEFTFLDYKISKKASSQLLIQDYELALADVIEVPEIQKDCLKLIQGALQLSASILAQDKTQLASQLIGRLLGFDSPEIQKMLADAKEWKGSSWLCPLNPVLSEPNTILKTILSSHAGGINSLAVTKETEDRHWIISASEDKTLKIWDLKNGTLARTLLGHEDSVTSIAVTPDGKVGISASEDSNIIVWDLENDSVKQIFRVGARVKTKYKWRDTYDDEVIALAITPDGNRAVFTCGWLKRTLKVWDINSGLEPYEIASYDGWIDKSQSVAITPDGQKVTAILKDVIKIWDIEKRQELYTLIGHTDSVNSITISPDGKLVISASYDKTIRIWDIETGIKKRTLKGHSGGVNGVVVTSNGQQLVSVSSDRTLKVWDIKSGEILKNIDSHGINVSVAAITLDGKQAIAAAGNNLKVWDWNLDGKDQFFEQGKGNSLTAIASDGKLAVSTSNDNILKIWDLKTGTVNNKFIEHTAPILSVAIIQEWQRIISISNDNTLKVWNTANAELVCSLNIGNAISNLAVSSDGSLAFTTDNSTIKVWDINNGKELYTLPKETRFLSKLRAKKHTNSISQLAITPDNKYIISGSYDTNIIVWNLKSCLATNVFRGHFGAIQSIVTNGKIVVSAESYSKRSKDNLIQVWNLKNGIKLHTLPGHTESLTSLALSPNGKWIILGAGDGKIIVWDTQSGAEKFNLSGHTDRINAISVTANDSFIASVSDDYTLKIWDLNQERMLASFNGDEPLVNCAISANGETIIVSSSLGKIYCFKLNIISSNKSHNINAQILKLADSNGKKQITGFRLILYQMNLIRQWLLIYLSPTFHFGSKPKDMPCRIALSERWLELIDEFFQSFSFSSRRPYDRFWRQNPFYAVTQSILAESLLQSEEGNLSDNIERAIKELEEVLKVFFIEPLLETPTKSYIFWINKADWGLTHKRLGIAYLLRTKGDRATNIESAIYNFKESLKVFSPIMGISHWFATQLGLSVAYYVYWQNLYGKTIDVQEQSVETEVNLCDYSGFLNSLENLALQQPELIDKMNNTDLLGNPIDIDYLVSQVKDFILFPPNPGYFLRRKNKDALLVQLSQIGNTYLSLYQDLPQNEQLEVVEQAIKIFDYILNFFPRWLYPKEWLSLNLSLALAYARQIKLGQLKNLEQAIKAFKEVETVVQVDTFSEEIPEALVKHLDKIKAEIREAWSLVKI